MSAFCVFGMTEPLAKSLAARKAPPQEGAGKDDRPRTERVVCGAGGNDT